MNIIRYFFNQTKTTIFLVAFSITFFTILVIYISFQFISNSILEDYKQQYYTEKAYQMSFIFRTGYQLLNGSSEENLELFNQMAREFTTPIEFISSDREEIIYQNDLSYEEFDELYTVELPTVKEGETVGFIRAHFDLTKDTSFPLLIALENNIKIWFRNTVIIAMGIATGLTWLVARKYANEIDESALQAVKVLKGNRDVTVTRSGTNEIKILTDSINYLLREFNNMEVWRKRMMEDLTHELRTPLTSVLTRLEAIIDGVYPNTEKNLQDIYEELDRFSRLVNDVQQLSEAESARFKLNIKKVDMIDLVKGVYEGFTLMAKKKRINMHFEDLNVPCSVYVDPDRMIQVVANLISNAIKYTPAGGNIWIRFQIETDYVILYCQDSGIGITESEQDLIFNRFYRIEKSRTRENGGSGIGLSISKALVHAHGGQIGVTSELGTGSEFWVKIPLDNQLVSIMDGSD